MMIMIIIILIRNNKLTARIKSNPKMVIVINAIIIFFLRIIYTVFNMLMIFLQHEMKKIPIAINHYSLSYKVKHFQIKMIKSKLMIAAIS